MDVVKILKLIFNRAFPTLILLLLQITALIFILSKFNEYFVYFYWISLFVNIVIVLAIINGRSNGAYKIAWIVPILIFPIFGGPLYLLFGGKKLSKRSRQSMSRMNTKLKSVLSQDSDVSEELRKLSRAIYNQSLYMQNYALNPVYRNSSTKYFKLGELAFEEMLKALKDAKRYVFIEYFIIERGKMWDSMLEILAQKAKEGVDVRVIYDDVGCLFTLPFNYRKKLESLGIKCQVFHPLSPVLSSKFNTRDHRKILVIDGLVGFTGGINLADEYINEVEKYGHWKDCALAVKGDAVWNFTVLFLTMWEYLSGAEEDFAKYTPCKENTDIISDGFVQPFSDTPLDFESLSENVYVNMLGSATDYAYIATPYLILDDELKTSLCAASKRGVDVRILTPGIPDKKSVFAVSRSYYDELLESGIKIYEYTPGFMHSKFIVSDDEVGMVGSINLDFRSLYLHFECGVWLYKSSSLLEMKRDFLETIEISNEVSLSSASSVKLHSRLKRSVLRLFAPLM